MASGRWRRVGRGVLRTLIVVEWVILALAVTLIIVDLSGLPRRLLVSRLPAVERALGRQVLVGTVRLQLWPAVGAELRDLTIAARPEPRQTGVLAEPPLRIARLRAGVALWPLLRSWGRELRVAQVSGEGLTLLLVVRPDGRSPLAQRLSIADVVAQLKDLLAELRLEPRQVELVRRASIARLTLSETTARLVVMDRLDRRRNQAPLELALGPLRVRGQELGLSRVGTLEVDGALARAGAGAPPPPEETTAPLTLHLAVGPLPALVPRAGEPVLAQWLEPATQRAIARQALPRGLTLRVAALQIDDHIADTLARLWPAVLPVQLPGPAALVPTNGLIDANLQFERRTDERPDAAATTLQLRGSAGVKGLVLTQRGRGARDPRASGAPAELRLFIDAQGETERGDVQVRELRVLINGMAVSGRADLRGLRRRPEIHELSLHSQGLVLEGLAALLPPAVLPAGTVLRGPLALGVTASGPPDRSRVLALVDLTPATLVLPVLYKPAGTALSTTLRGELREGGMDVQELGVTVGPLALISRGRLGPGDHVDLQMDSGAVQLTQLLLLSPLVRDEVTARLRRARPALSGALRVSGSLVRDGERARAALTLTVTGAALRLRPFSALGGLRIETHAQMTGPVTELRADADLTPLLLRVPRYVDKPRGAVLRSSAVLTLRDGEPQRWQAGLRLPGGTLDLRGRVDIEGDRALRVLSLSADRGEVDLQRIGRVVLPLRGQPLPRGRVRFAAQLRGDPRDGDDVRLQVRDLAFSGDFGTLRGQADLVGLPAPRQVSLSVSGEELALAALASALGPQVARHVARGPGGRLSLAAQIEGDLAGATTQEELLRRLRGEVRFAVTNTRVYDLFTRVKLESGLLGFVVGNDGIIGVRVEELTVDAASGRLRLQGGQLETTEALRFQNRYVLAGLRGTVTLPSQALALAGTLEILPAALAAQSRGAVATDAAVPVNLRIGGDARLPVIGLDNLDKTTGNLIGGFLGLSRAPQVAAPRRTLPPPSGPPAPPGDPERDRRPAERGGPGR